ncbi:hypothetical protein SCHPADRAFT_890566 [Schizopora paradoxa]|uniref:Restriction of telomere capping protein 4 n=1 Tax=Schizopora paradoxa TaxID=27342 RepID=A0A0H2S7F3_9AGAM|nr:hypothetical protein SCHPADRAFT_890566 [Schizopora paradoxa]
MAKSSTKSSTRHHTKNSSRRDSLRQREAQLEVDLSDPKLKRKPKGRPFRSESAKVKGYNVQKEMGLANNDKLYLRLLGAVRESAAGFFKHPDQGIRAQGQLNVSAFVVKMVTKHPFFGKFQNAWPVTDMLGMVLANRAAGRKRADDGDLNAHLAAIDPLEGDVENEDFSDVPRDEDEEGSEVSEQQQDTPPKRRAAMKTKETKTPRIQSDKQTKKRLAKRRNQVLSDDESEEEPQPLKLSKHTNQDAMQSDQESNFGDENGADSGNELSYADNQPDTPAKSDAHEPSPEPIAVDAPADVPRADLPLRDRVEYCCPDCSEEMSPAEAEFASETLQLMLEWFQYQTIPMDNNALDQTKVDICYRLRSEKRIISSTLDRNLPYLLRYNLDELQGYLDGAFVRRVQDYLLDPFSTLVWQKIKDERVKLESDKHAISGELQGGGYLGERGFMYILEAINTIAPVKDQPRLIDRIPRGKIYTNIIGPHGDEAYQHMLNSYNIGRFLQTVGKSEARKAEFNCHLKNVVQHIKQLVDNLEYVRNMEEQKQAKPNQDSSNSKPPQRRVTLRLPVPEEDSSHPKQKRKQTVVRNTASVKDFPSSSSQSEAKKPKAKQPSKPSKPTISRTTRSNSRIANAKALYKFAKVYISFISQVPLSARWKQVCCSLNRISDDIPKKFLRQSEVSTGFISVYHLDATYSRLFIVITESRLLSIFKRLISDSFLRTCNSGNYSWLFSTAEVLGLHF